MSTEVDEERAIFLTESNEGQRIDEDGLRKLGSLLHVLKFDPNQPRYPKGHPLGGHWRDSGGTSSAQEYGEKERLKAVRAGVEKARNEVMDWNNKTGREKLVLVSRAGQRMYAKGGGKSSVEFDSTILKHIQTPGKDITLVHNHPRMTSLSTPDFMVTAFVGVKEIEAVSRDGPSQVVFRGSLNQTFPEKITPSTAEEGAYALQGIVQEAGAPIRHPFRNLMDGGHISIPEANLLHTHLVREAMRDAGYFNYEVEDPSGYIDNIAKKVEKAGIELKFIRRGIQRIIKYSRQHAEWEDFWKSMENLKDKKVAADRMAEYMMVDPPLLEYMGEKELKAWMDELQAMPLFYGKREMLAAVRERLSGKDLAFILKFDPSQPREPAGSPKGGQWTKSRGIRGFLGRIGQAIRTTLDLDQVQLPTERYTEDLYNVDRKTPVNTRLLEDRDKQLKRHVNYYGLNEDFRAADRNVTRLVKTADMHINMHSMEALEGILAAGRLKSQQELYGDDIPTFIDRGEDERTLFGYSRPLQDSEHPIYGYLADATYDDALVREMYGDIRLTTKWGVREKATFTGGDSLGSGRRIPYVPSPMSKPSMASTVPISVRELEELGGTKKYLQGLAKANGIGDIVMANNSDYFEFQVHGGVSVSEIMKVSVPSIKDMPPALRERLEDAGIKVEEYR